MARTSVISGLAAATAAIAIFSGTSRAQSSLTPQQIDHMIRAEWKQQEIVPSAPVDDAGYLRRIYIDITGSIPPASAAEDFIADHSPDKRARAVDSLLDSPGYANQWTNYWDGVLMSTARSQVIDRGAFRQWLRTQFTKNTPWNRFVYDLITATGQNSLGGTYKDTMMEGSQTAQLNSGETGVINGATN